MFKKIIIITSVILVVTLGFFIIASIPKKINLTVIPEAHSFVSLLDEEESLTFSILINQKNTYITEVANIKAAYICDNEEDNLYPIKIDDITYVDKQRINKDTYYVYNFTFKSQSIESEFTLTKAYLLLDYKACKMKVYIGSFSSYKVTSYNNDMLRINNLKGIVNINEGKKVLVGVKFRFKNETKNEVTITNIKPLNKVLVVNYCEVNDKEVPSQTNINELISKPYEQENYRNFSINQEVETEVNLLCTLGYLDDYQIDTLGFKIDFKVNNEVKTMVFAPFTFYQDHEKYVSIKDLTFYQVPND